MRTFGVLCNGELFHVSKESLLKTGLFDTHGELFNCDPYVVKSPVSVKMCDVFLRSLAGSHVQVTKENYHDLHTLSQEFEYSGFDAAFAEYAHMESTSTGELQRNVIRGAACHRAGIEGVIMELFGDLSRQILALRRQMSYVGERVRHVEVGNASNEVAVQKLKKTVTKISSRQQVIDDMQERMETMSGAISQWKKNVLALRADCQKAASDIASINSRQQKQVEDLQAHVTCLNNVARSVQSLKSNSDSLMQNIERLNKEGKTMSGTISQCQKNVLALHADCHKAALDIVRINHHHKQQEAAIQTQTNSLNTVVQCVQALESRSQSMTDNVERLNREVKTLKQAQKAPAVQAPPQTMSSTLSQVRPVHDPHGGTRVTVSWRQSPFDGIIARLWRDNAQDLSDIIAVDSIGPKQYARSILDFANGNTFFMSRQTKQPWISLEFLRHRVAPSHYTIRVPIHMCQAHGFPLSWRFEVRNSQGSWITLDERADSTFQRGNSTVTFQIQQRATEPYDFIRLRLLASTATDRGQLTLILSGFEMFGQIFCYS